VVTDRIPREGRATATRDLVLHPGGVAVLPILSDDRILLVFQCRHGAGRPLWEIPAGTMEPGESPETCARRELLEETGYAAGRWTPRGIHFPTPGYSTEQIALFSATDLVRTEATVDPNEIQTVRAFAEDELRGMHARGELVDGKTLLALALHGRWGWPPSTSAAREAR
jgi:ADP-ribose pyrophosphatase